MDVALNNLQRLICHKIQPTNQPGTSGGGHKANDSASSKSEDSSSSPAQSSTPAAGQDAA